MRIKCDVRFAPLLFTDIRDLMIASKLYDVLRTFPLYKCYSVRLDLNEIFCQPNCCLLQKKTEEVERKF